MGKVDVNITDGIATLKLDNGVTNAISPELVKDVAATVKEVRNNARGLLLTGGEKFLSIGFYLPDLLPLSREELGAFFTNFNSLILELYCLPMPTVCSIAGHATGGGNILALVGDYRYMAEGKKLIGLNEVNLGLPVPYLADMILRQVVGDRVATEMLFEGNLFSSAEAHAFGLVDELCQPDTLDQKALEKLASLAAKPAAGFAPIKANRTGHIWELYEKNGAVKNEQFVDIWFSAEAQKSLTKAAEKF